MASSVNPPRGMRDFLPADKAHRERVLGVIRNTYRAHGFDEIETPVVEDSDRLHAGLGGDNEKLAFAVMKRGLTTEHLTAVAEPLELADLGLRFDLTVPLARFYASHRGELPSVFRSIQIGSVWRAERPQKGRYRQFVQCDIDIIGESGAIAEVELITATVATLDRLGMHDYTIRINDRRLLTAMIESWGIPAEETEHVLVTLDKLDKIGIAGIVDELHDKGFGSAAPEIKDYLTHLLVDRDGIESSSLEVPATQADIERVLPPGADATVIAALTGIASAVNEVVGRPVVQFDPWLVRGMGYYTGAIFEVAHRDFGYSLGGGGRYDGMIGRFLGSDVPAAGFSLGFERLVDLVSLPDEEKGDAVALIHDGVSPADLVALQARLVGEGRRVRIERRPRNLAPLLAQLAASGFTEYAAVSASTTELEFKPIG
jgi:histidyl-tRNA synthetase